MTTTQLRLFSSTDTGAPVISGSGTGSLLNVLNACLVTGYGTTPSAGWTKPFADTGSVGAITQGTGSRMTLAIVDANQFVASGKEARIIGLETCFSVDNSVPSGSAAIPGLYSFPSGSASGLRYINGPGYLIARKSNTIDGTTRPWYVFADSSSMYCFIQTGDGATFYHGFFFGDIFSYKSASLDSYKCLIIGRVNENSATATLDYLDILGGANLNTSVNGHFAARSHTGLGRGIAIAKHGDAVKGNTAVTIGLVQYPNGADSSMYVSPVWVNETSNRTIRGHMKGFWQYLHAVGTVSDGMAWSGSAELAGRTFCIIKTSGNNGVYLMETSNTVESNE